MKTLLKLTLIAALLVSSSSLSAQKMGYINSEEILFAMPEMDSVQIKSQQFVAELSEMLDIMRVEFNTKFADYQKQLAGMSDAVKNVKEKELSELDARSKEFEANAQKDVQSKQAELMQPVIKKLQDAIEKVSKENGLVVVFDVSRGSLAYFDKDVLIDASALVKTYLGVKIEEPVAAAK